MRNLLHARIQTVIRRGNPIPYDGLTEQTLLICTYNPRNTTDPPDIVFRVEAFAEAYGVQLDRAALTDTFAGCIAGECFFSGLKEDDRKLAFRMHGRQCVETQWDLY